MRFNLSQVWWSNSPQRVRYSGQNLPMSKFMLGGRDTPKLFSTKLSNISTSYSRFREIKSHTSSMWNIKFVGPRIFCGELQKKPLGIHCKKYQNGPNSSYVDYSGTSERIGLIFCTFSYLGRRVLHTIFHWNWLTPTLSPFAWSIHGHTLNKQFELGPLGE